LQPSLFCDSAARCSPVAWARDGANVFAILFGSDLEEPPQHELDTIDLQTLKRFRIHKSIWIRTAATQEETQSYSESLPRQGGAETPNSANFGKPHTAHHQHKD
jgi:hypothetical protein